MDKLSPINFSDKCCGKISMCLTNFFFQVKLQKFFTGFFKNREQFTDTAAASNKTKRDFFKLQQDVKDAVHFFHSANSLA